MSDQVVYWASTTPWASSPQSVTWPTAEPWEQALAGSRVDWADSAHDVDVEETPAVVTVNEKARSVVTWAGPVGPQGVRGPAGTTDAVVLSRQASVTLSGHRAVTINDDGLLIYADSSNLDHVDRPLWLALGAITVSLYGDVLASGTHTEPSWTWTPGDPIYLGANGVMTQTVPTSGFLVQLASAETATTIFYDPGVPIVLD